MGFEDTSLKLEVDEILTNTETFTNHHWRCELKVRGEKDPIQVLKLLSVDNKRDYVGAYGDEIIVEVVIGGGTFAHDVFPKRAELQMTLFRDPLAEVSEEIDLSKDIEAQVFTAVLVDEQSAALEANDLRLKTKYSGDMTHLKQVRFQLIDQALEQIRMQSVGGVFRDTSVAEVLKYLLTTMSNELDVDEANRIVGVDMVPPHNTHPQKNIVLPHGLRFSDMPEYLTQKCAGIYNSGFGVFLQRHTWYVYPTHDLTRYGKTPKGLTLINVPKNRYPNVERTFRRTPNQIIAMVTGDVRHRDPSERKQLNDGNGIRYTDARNVIDGFSVTSNNRTLLLRANNNSEFMSTERPNGLNNVHLSPRRITSNTFAEASRMAARKGCYVTCVWENSDPGAIEPGMPVKFMYAVKDEVFEAVGVVVQAHHTTGLGQQGFSATRHITNTALQLFLEGDLEWDNEEAA